MLEPPGLLHPPALPLFFFLIFLRRLFLGRLPFVCLLLTRWQSPAPHGSDLFLPFLCLLSLSPPAYR